MSGVGGVGSGGVEGVSPRQPSRLDADDAVADEPAGVVKWNTTRMAGSAQMAELASMARLLDAEPRAAALPVKAKGIEVPEVAEMPTLTPAGIEKGLASKNPDEVNEAMHALRGLAESDPEAAVAILKKLPIEKGLEIASWIRGKLAGPEVGAAEKFLTALSHDADFAGRWAAKLAGTPGTDLLPYETGSAQEAVTKLVQIHAGDKKQLAAFTAAMYKQGGDGALASTLSSLSDAGPTPTAIAFLRGLKGKGCDNYLARVLGSKDKGKSEEKAQVEQAIATLLRNIPKVTGSMDGEGARLAKDVLSAAKEAIGDNAAAQREFKSALRSLLKKWSDPDMAKSADRLRYEETVSIEKDLIKLRDEYETILTTKTGAAREIALQKFVRKLSQVKDRVDISLPASGGNDVGEWPLGIDREPDDSIHTGRKSERAAKAKEEQEENLRKFDHLIGVLDTYNRARSYDIDDGTVGDPDIITESHVRVVTSAIENALRK